MSQLLWRASGVSLLPDAPLKGLRRNNLYNFLLRPGVIV
jgi:hypothetical protein